MEALVLTVETSGGSKRVSIDASARVCDLKEKVKDLFDVPVELQVLLKGSQPLLYLRRSLKRALGSETNITLVKKCEAKASNISTLCSLLESKISYIKEEAIISLSQIAKISTSNCAAILKEKDVIMKIAKIGDTENPRTLIKCLKTISILCNGAKAGTVKPAVGLLMDALYYSDFEVLRNALIALKSVNAEEIDIKSIAPRLVELLHFEEFDILNLSLELILNFTATKFLEERRKLIENPSISEQKSKNSSLSDIAESFVGVKITKKLSNILKMKNSILCTLTYQVISNLIVGGQIQDIIKNEIFNTVIQSLKSASLDLKEKSEAAWVLMNLACDGTNDEKKHLISLGGVPVLVNLLEDMDTNIVVISLEGILNLLSMEDVKAQVESSGGLKAMLIHAGNMKNQKIQSKVLSVLKQHFPEQYAIVPKPEPQGDKDKQQDLDDNDDDDDGKDEPVKEGEESIKVVIRCRPFIKNEAKDCKDVVHVDKESNMLYIKDPANSGFNPEERKTWRKFTFDTVYDKDSKQKDVYKRSVSKMVRRLLNGFNSTIFAYGQTSSGKTHTMMGVIGHDDLEGLTPRLIRSLFHRIDKGREKGNTFLITLSYLEIYNERVYDLLAHTRGGKRKKQEKREALQIRQMKESFHVPKLTKHVVTDEMQMLAFIDMGSRNRSVAATSQNSESSRSHSMLIVYIEKGAGEAMKNIVGAKLNLVDLAGSERFQGLTAKMQKESTSINQSLTSLANVIAALTSTKKGTFVPYRNSALTKLLRDSLGGNASTLMFANINPCDRNVNETVSTLRYASRAKKIKNKPKVNQNPKDALLTKLRGEIKTLRAMLEEKDKYINNIGPTATKVQEPTKTKEQKQEEERHREFVEKVRQDLLSRLNDAKQAVIRGGEGIERMASPRAARAQNPFKGRPAQRRKTIMIGAGKNLLEEGLDLDTEDKSGATLKRGSRNSDTSTLRSSRAARRTSISELIPKLNINDEIQAGVFKAMRQMRKSKKKYQSQTIELKDILEVTRQEKNELESQVEDLETKLLESENRITEVEDDLDQAQEREDELVSKMRSMKRKEIEISQKLQTTKDELRKAKEIEWKKNKEMDEIKRQLSEAEKIKETLSKPAAEKTNEIMGKNSGDTNKNCQMLSQYLNQVLSASPLLLKLNAIPLNPRDSNEFIEKMKDGIIPAVVLNMAVPNTIDERALNIKTDNTGKLPLEARRDNLTLVIESSRAIGCDMEDLSVDDLVPVKEAKGKDYSENSLSFSLRVVEFALLQRKKLLSHPEVARTGIKQQEDEADLLPKDIILKWLNAMMNSLEDVKLLPTGDFQLNLPLTDIPGDEYWSGCNRLAALLSIALTLRLSNEKRAKRLFTSLYKTGDMLHISPTRFVQKANAVLPDQCISFLRYPEEVKETEELISQRKRSFLFFASSILKHSFALKFCAEREIFSKQLAGHKQVMHQKLQQAMRLIDKAKASKSSNLSEETKEDTKSDAILTSETELKDLEKSLEEINIPLSTLLEQPLEEEAVAKEDKRDAGALRVWVNCLRVQKKFVHRLLNDCTNGVLLLKILDKLASGEKKVVNWKKAYINPTNKFRELANCSYFIELCRKSPFKFKLGTTTGSDINEKNSKHLLAILWQLMQFHMFDFLKQIYEQKFGMISLFTNKKGRSRSRSKYNSLTRGGVTIDEDKLVQWSVTTAQSALDSPPSNTEHLKLKDWVKIKAFDDKSIKNSLFLLILLWIHAPNRIDWDAVTLADSEEEQYANARYAISVARKMGATVFLIPEDIVEVRPKLILAFVGAILALN
mmetsp:Transcript_12382/g.18481  ORF Transcript_12382/g.18481 Transcript_12382/m.18481 type:complete len:1791 (+) Transcript_12382:2-5374(+)